MKKKLIFLLSLALSGMFALGAAACGEETSSSTGSSSQSSSSSQSASSSQSGSSNSSSSQQKQTYTLSFKTSGSAVASVTAEEGTEIDLTQYISEKTGAQFIGWYRTNDLTCKQLTSLTLVENVELSAIFTGEVFGNDDYIYLGQYPQMRIKDKALIAALNENSDEYDAKVTYEGKEYYKERWFRDGLRFTDGSEAYGNYYFELQPLLWERVSTSGGISTWVTTQIIDAVVYNDDGDSFSHYYETDYCEFAHKDFLYETDYFSEAERDLMAYTKTDDDMYSVVYVTALDEYAYENGIGFNTLGFYSDYAAMQGLPYERLIADINGSYCFSRYWLYYEDASWHELVKVSKIGTKNKEVTCGETLGFRPVIRLDLRERYTVTFDTKGGTPVESITDKAFEGFEATTTRNGYEFGGWYKDEACTQPINSIPESDVTVYAKWTALEYDISYELNVYYGLHKPAATNHAENPVKYTVEDDAALQAATAKSDSIYIYYNFAGWYKDEQLTQKVENVSDIGGGDVTLYAKWTPIDYAITYVLNGGTNHAENPAAINYETKKITLKEPTKAGHSFEGWYLEENFQTQVESLLRYEPPFTNQKPIGEVTLYALFEEVYERTEGDVIYRIKDDVVTIVALADSTKTSVTIPATVEGKAVNKIAASTFANASQITDITFECPASVTSDVTSAHFAGLTNLQNVNASASLIGKIVKHLPNATLKCWTVTDQTMTAADFAGGIVEKVVVGEKVATISDGAFNKFVGVKEVSMHKDVAMGASNYYLTTSSAANGIAFEILTVPSASFLSKFYKAAHTEKVKNVTILGGAFTGACVSAEKLTLGSGVTAGSNYSFLSNLANLKEIVIDEANTVFTLEDGALLASGKLVYLMSGAIPSTVTEIVDYAAVSKSITELVIPEGVMKVGNYAFNKCTWITKLSLPASLKTIGGSSAFNDEISTLELYGTVTGGRLSYGVDTLIVKSETVKASAFATWNVKTADLQGVKTLGAEAFRNCLYLESVNMPALTSAGEYVFSGCKRLITVTFGENFTEIPNYMFAKKFNVSTNCCIALETVNLTHIKKIGTGAFYGCEKLNVTFGDKLETIGGDAFIDCAITGEVSLPATLKSVGASAFSGNEGITAIKYAGTLTQWEAVANYGMIKHGVDYYCGGDKITQYTPSGDVKNYVFAYNKSLESVNLTNAKTIGEGAFAGCEKLTAVTGVAEIETIGASAFKACAMLSSLDNLIKVTAIGDYAFNACTTLPVASIASATKVTTIGKYAFEKCTGFTGVAPLNEGLTHLGDYAFSGCTGITKVVFPSTLTNLGSRTFKNAGLTEVVFHTNKLDSGDGTGDYWYEGLQVETITVTVQPKDTNNGVIRLENHSTLLKNVKTLKLTGECQTLYMAAQGLQNLETLILDEGIKSVGGWSVRNLPKLKTLVVKADVTSFPCNKLNTFDGITTITNLYANSAVKAGLEATGNAGPGITVTNYYTADEWTGL